MTPDSTTASQRSRTGFCPLEAAVATTVTAGLEPGDAVFTRHKLAEFILDLTGSADQSAAEAARTRS
jgi:hypothetical protein